MKEIFGGNLSKKNRPEAEGLLSDVGAEMTAGHTRRVSQIIEIISSAELHREDVVLECFSGPGSITIPLALNCRRVIAVEFGPAVTDRLQHQLHSLGIENVGFIIGDICERSTLECILRKASSITKHVHTPGYPVIRETLTVCSWLGPPVMNVVPPLSLLKSEWARKDYSHIRQCQERFADQVATKTLEVLGVYPLRKLPGKASSGIFRIRCPKSIPVATSLISG